MRSESRAHEFTCRGVAARLKRQHARRLPGCWRLFAIASLAMLTVGSSSGCSSFENLSQSFRYSPVWNDAATKMRHRSLSSKSWHRHKNRYCNEACMSDFCDGYRQGFEDVAGGGTGCTPNFPPRDYWGWQHQSAEGQRKVSAWFAGYPHGARAAEEEGVGSWSQIQMSSNLQAQYVTAGMLPNQGHAVYPITEPMKTPPMGGPTPAGAPQAATPMPGMQTPMPIGSNVGPVPQTQAMLPGTDQDGSFGQFGMATPYAQQQ